MVFWLGVDLGTTSTAAAVYRDGRAEVLGLGHRRDEIPSAVFVGADDEVLVGEAAVRRGLTQPERLAQEFKRRVGDPVPILIGGSPFSASALMARILKFVLGRVSAEDENAPAAIVLTHPANWGPFKQDLLLQTARMADLESISLRSEPECAAVTYTAGEQVRPGEIVAVYDLGGGTFDAAVLRKTPDGFVLLGKPEGIEQLGGIDFDDAVFHHVLQAVGDTERFDLADAAVRSGLQRLRRDCVEAKEFLSYDASTTIPVTLPKLHTSVRISQSEFEGMVRPALLETVAALRRALRSANVTPDQLRSVLLAGGSSRIPLVKDLIVADLRCPVILGSHPKQGVALGAALLAATTQSTSGGHSTHGPSTRHSRLNHHTFRPSAIAATGHPAPPAADVVGRTDGDSRALVVANAADAAGPRHRRRLVMLSVSSAMVLIAALVILIVKTRSSSTPGLGAVTQVSAGAEYSCALLTGGAVSCWGVNSSGQLGDGTTTDRPTPVAVSGLTGVTAIAAGYAHTCALLVGGTVRCWGRNDYGQLGDGTTTNHSKPIAVVGLTGVTSIAATLSFHTCALLTVGDLRCWGDNDSGQLGDGTTTNRTTPVAVTGLTDAIAVAAGYARTCALLTSRTLRCWGANKSGQLGDGSTANRLTPVAVTGLTGATAIAMGSYHTCALIAGGSLRCWGNNDHAQLGDGTTTDRPNPISVSGLTDATAIAAGAFRTCALLSGGTVSCWGLNRYGQLGDGTSTDRPTPAPVATLTGAAAIAAGDYHACAILTDTTLRCWGFNFFGQVGDGSTTDRLKPATVSG